MNERIYSGDEGIQVSVGGEWADAEIVGSGKSRIEGFWFFTREYRPKFFVQDEGVTWRKRP